MDKVISIMIFSQAPDTIGKLEADLHSLNFLTMTGIYPEMDFDNIVLQNPDIALIDFTNADNDMLITFDILRCKGLLPKHIIPVALISINSVRQIPLNIPVVEFIIYPYDIVELEFRLRRVVNNDTETTVDDYITIGNLTISPSRYQVTTNGKPVILSYREYQLIKYLMTHPNRVFSRENLLESVWEENLVIGIRTVDVHIRRLRAKIGDISSRYIKTVRGVGYTFRSIE